MRLKILSLWQPHATLCVTPSLHNPKVPAKPIETRSWSTAHRGWLGIHSAMRKDPDYKEVCNKHSFRKYIADFDKLPFGYILGAVKIVDCFSTDSYKLSKAMAKIAEDRTLIIKDLLIDLSHRINEISDFGDFSEGRYGFVISDFVQFETPIKARGTQGFWFYELPDSYTELITHAPA